MRTGTWPTHSRPRATLPGRRRTGTRRSTAGQRRSRRRRTPSRGLAALESLGRLPPGQQVRRCAARCGGGGPEAADLEQGEGANGRGLRSPADLRLGQVVVRASDRACRGRRDARAVPGLAEDDERGRGEGEEQEPGSSSSRSTCCRDATAPLRQPSCPRCGKRDLRPASGRRHGLVTPLVPDPPDGHEGSPGEQQEDSRHRPDEDLRLLARHLPHLRVPRHGRHDLRSRVWRRARLSNSRQDRQAHQGGTAAGRLPQVLHRRNLGAESDNRRPQQPRRNRGPSAHPTSNVGTDSRPYRLRRRPPLQPSRCPVHDLKLAIALLDEGNRMWSNERFADRGNTFKPTFVRNARVLLMQTLVLATRDMKTAAAKRAYKLEDVEEIADRVIREHPPEEWHPRDGSTMRVCYSAYPVWEAYLARGYVWGIHAGVPLLDIKPRKYAFADLAAAKNAAEAYDKAAAILEDEAPDFTRYCFVLWYATHWRLRAGGLSVRELRSRVNKAKEATEETKRFVEDIEDSFDDIRKFCEQQLKSLNESLRSAPPGITDRNTIKPIPTLNCTGLPRSFNTASLIDQQEFGRLPGDIGCIDQCG